ncbi:MAG: hypothetical protein ACPGWR_03830 [Ardenticatenaceae bacterium]
MESLWPSTHLRKIPTLRPDEKSGVCRGGNPNVLTLDKGTSRLGQGSIAHSCLVEVELFENQSC